MENLGEGAEEGERRKEDGESVVLFILLFEKEEGERRKCGVIHLARLSGAWWRRREVG